MINTQCHVKVIRGWRELIVHSPNVALRQSKLLVLSPSPSISILWILYQIDASLSLPSRRPLLVGSSLSYGQLQVQLQSQKWDTRETEHLQLIIFPEPMFQLYKSDHNQQDQPPLETYFST